MICKFCSASKTRQTSKYFFIPRALKTHHNRLFWSCQRLFRLLVVMVLTGMKLSQTLSMAFSQLLFDFGFMFPFTVIQTGGKERTTEELGFSPPTLSQPI